MLPHMTTTTGKFVLTGGVGFNNAVRRTLQTDLQGWAPRDVLMQHNGTCQTDEFLAARIGLIPFRRVGNGDTLALDRTGPGTITAADFTGPGFEPVHGEIEVMLLGEGQRLACEVRFDRRAVREHARYARCGAVGMSRIDAERYCLQFESIAHEAPHLILNEALDLLEGCIDRALRALAEQPDEPPRSFC